jgi:uncharacterized protein YjiS (DUF1127 family)
MNPSSTSTILSSRPGSDPVFGQFGGFFRTTLRSLRLQWILHRAQRRKVRPIESIGEMNAHLLKDIGVAENTLSRRPSPGAAYERHGIPFGLSAILLAIALGGTAAPTSAQTIARGNAEPQVASAPMAGVFAGEYVNGAPVYRFPAVVVTGPRKDPALAKSQPCRQTVASGAKTPA